jgi:hypothetical protein
MKYQGQPHEHHIDDDHDHYRQRGASEHHPRRVAPRGSEVVTFFLSVVGRVREP